MDDLAIIDANHHFWDLALRQHPALIGAVDAGLKSARHFLEVAVFGEFSVATEQLR